jgi:hypothetical protein
MSRGAVLAASLLAVVVVAVVVGGASFVRRRARTEAEKAIARAPGAADPIWCGKPLGARAVGQLKDPSTCGKISLTGTAPACFFWADCGDFHFEIDCASRTAGPGQCRCDGEDGRTVPYRSTFCTLDPTQPSAGLRAVLDSAANACRWTPP